MVKRPAMAEPVILDVVELPEEEKPTMWDIAQTFPAYDWSINAFHRDGLTKEEDDRFLLEGDHSQPPVEIKQASEKEPLKVEVAIGPIHDGFGFRKPKLHYTFKRVEGGWKRQAWHVTYHGPPNWRRRGRARRSARRRTARRSKKSPANPTWTRSNWPARRAGR
jgi:hypothetical protein